MFGSPRFAFVAEQLRRVRDRFEQVRIAREDVAYVVSHRLLVKTDEQLARITEHLRQFTPLYHRMAERLGEFAALFPVHPAYIETFERVYVAEKREVLKTLSGAMRSIFDQEVPADRPGLISYDQYWAVLCDNPSMRSLPDVAEVIDKSNVLEGRVRNAYTRPHLRPMAIRIIHALSVQRLTTDDIHVPLGVTPEELRDGLCLHVSLPERTAEFLLDQVQVALREIMRTVSGQYISLNDANGQYYLDVKKDIDFDAKISQRGETMGSDELNRYFYDALRQAFNLSDTTYTPGHRIWFYESPWADHKVTRPGCLFFGAPDDRSTAQPPRDFYVYILPPFMDREWHDEQRSDEVLFELTGVDQTFKQILQRYAGARAMFGDAASHRNVYAEKADVQLGDRLLPWLRQSLPRHLQVTYQGVSLPVGEVLSRLRSTASRTVEELLQVVASHLLATEFPFFPHGVTHDGRKVRTRKVFPCPSCRAQLSVRRVERVMTYRGKKRALVWVNAGTARSRVNREPREHDRHLARRAQRITAIAWFPQDSINPNRYSAKLAQLGAKGITDISRFLSTRNLIAFADLWDRVSRLPDPPLRHLCQAVLTSTFTVISERQGYFGGGGGMSGNLYMPIVRMEKNIFHCLQRKLRRLRQAEQAKRGLRSRVIVTTQSTTGLDSIPDASVDYIYTDPPFGANIIYSEMNLLLEGWLRVKTNDSLEAVIDPTATWGSASTAY